MWRLLFAFFFVFFGILNFAQIQKDTAFTVQSEFKKHSKNYPHISIVNYKRSTEVTEFQEIVYKKIEGRALHLDAFINSAKKKLPAVIMIHGGGWKSGNKEMQKPMAEAVADQKYQVFTIEYRLSDEAKYPAAIDDVVDAIQFVKNNASKYKVNPSKIAILGCSSGAQMASLIGQKFPKDIQSIISIDGILAFHHPESKEGKMAELWLGGSYEQIPEIWENASPLSHVSKNSPPILFVNSQFERFHAGRGDMVKAMNSFGIYSKIEKIEKSPHTFWLFNPWFQPTIRYVTEFLNLTIKKMNNENT